METLPAPEHGAPDHDAEVPRDGLVVDGRYRVGELLASGGMGFVYAATHVALGTRLAIKVLRPELGRDAEMVSRFRREARAASALGHPHIVDVRDFGTLPDGASYFVMERLDGRDLAEELARGPLSAARAAGIALQVLDALAAAHRQGIVHRDLKPENVFLVDRGPGDHVKVLDFGVAKILGDEGARTMLDLGGARATSGRALGTPAYMSPEQCVAGAIDPRSDLYALGVVLYEMVTGAVPFSRSDPYEVMRLHRTEPPRRPSELAPSIPPELERVILRCLEKSPDARFARAEDVATALAPLAPRAEPVQREFSRRAEPADRVGGGGRVGAGDRGRDGDRGGDGDRDRGRDRSPSPARRAPIAIALAGVALAALGTLAIAAALTLALTARRPPAATPPTATAPPTAAAPPTAIPAPDPVSVPVPAPDPAPHPDPATVTVTAPVSVPAPAPDPDPDPVPVRRRPPPAAGRPATATTPTSAPPTTASEDDPYADSPALRPMLDPWRDAPSP